MSMNRKAALAAGAMLGVAFLAACSDSPTAPTANVMIRKSSFALGDATNNTAEVGILKICKLGNVGGTFVVTLDPGAGGTGGGTALTPLTLANPNSTTTPVCRVAGLDNGDASQEKGDVFHVSENAAADPANTTQVLTSCVGIEGPSPCTGPAGSDSYNNNYFINTEHGWTITVRNTNNPPPPPSGCTFTKGWYQNKNGAPTITLTIDGRSPDDQRAIFAATPGKPGTVSWGVLNGPVNNKPNDLLNLYQQLLAALNNLKGDALGGPDAIDTAIAAALSVTGGTGTNITVTNGADIGGLTSTLSNFNEGNVTGFPHCQ